jgi:hypothetical protein
MADDVRKQYTPCYRFRMTLAFKHTDIQGTVKSTLSNPCTYHLNRILIALSRWWDN